MVIFLFLACLMFLISGFILLVTGVIYLMNELVADHPANIIFLGSLLCVAAGITFFIILYFVRAFVF